MNRKYLKFVSIIMTFTILNLSLFFEKKVHADTLNIQTNYKTETYEEILSEKLSDSIFGYDFENIVKLLNENPNINFGIRYFTSGEWGSPVESLLWEFYYTYQEIFSDKQQLKPVRKELEVKIKVLKKIMHVFIEHGADISSGINPLLREMEELKLDSELSFQKLQPKNKFFLTNISTLIKEEYRMQSKLHQTKIEVKSCHFSKFKKHVVANVKQWIREQKSNFVFTLSDQYYFEFSLSTHCFLGFRITFEGEPFFAAGRIPNLQVVESVTDMSHREVANEIIGILKNTVN